MKITVLVSLPEELERSRARWRLQLSPRGWHWSPVSTFPPHGAWAASGGGGGVHAHLTAQSRAPGNWQRSSEPRITSQICLHQELTFRRARKYYLTRTALTSPQETPEATAFPAPQEAARPPGTHSLQTARSHTLPPPCTQRHLGAPRPSRGERSQTDEKQQSSETESMQKDQKPNPQK